MGTESSGSGGAVILKVLFAIGIVLLLLSSFYGLTYMTNGNNLYSGGLAFFMTAALAFFVIIMASMKRKSQNTGFTIVEGVFIVLYTVIGLAASVAMAHYINVDFLLKDEIRDMGKAKLKELDNMLISYDEQLVQALDDIELDLENRIDDYKNTSDLSALRSSLVPYNITLDRASKSDLIEQAKSKKSAMLEVDSASRKDGFEQLLRETKNFIEAKVSVLNAWNRRQINRAFYEIDEKLSSNFSLLQTKFTPPSSGKYWNYEFEFNTSSREASLISNPRALIGRYKPNWFMLVGTILIIHFCLLSSYLFTKREGKRVFYSSKKTTRGIQV